MKINDFKLERYFAKHEFTAKYLLSSSDCDGFEMQYLIDLASDHELDLWKNLKLGYTESAGHPLLRESILQHYQQNDIENVVVASPGELNFMSMNILLSDKDHVVSVAPAYQSLHEIVRSLNCELSLWQPNSENWQFDVGELESLIQENTRLLIINFPHNPTGSYLTRNQLDKIVSIARKHNITIFSDEMYHKLVADDVEVLPPICDIYENGISLWGTSKSIGLAGLRTGWLVSQNKEFLRKVMSFKDYLSICNSAPAEILSIIALNNFNRLLDHNKDKIKTNINHFTEFVNQQDLFSSFITPKSGSTALIQLNIQENSIDFSNKLVNETGIMTVPAEMFDYKGKYIRIGFGRKNFPEVLEVFAKYLKSYNSAFTSK
ncbi:aminotransferase class I/II-fold pyridoxal phosphate-dependent enzyme [Marinifilum caeruleilacunae]|uniref:Aminotransferase class I/II-fold pyridoxal phosphate-dependent enzyme n=1 Tax=Marinifilum caeruleilacunae TaxID=2499076 RepID=A0ABX1WU97_9BACT|nr:aminotransferase class I/II-fold pyridoxal phosphate-dependent enzyme [Marinifilum caeruleilacunae]NOU59680.1 aminotransferase class I/II-fold pyridoxal phosphate-dependent enzyme [Marinifilum caeruleilacunae]